MGNEVDPKAFRPPARVTIVAGKGGVGKTTVCAALAYLCSLARLNTLVIEVEGKSGLPRLFGYEDELSYAEKVLLEPDVAGPGSGPVRARTLTPDDALVEYLEDHGLRRISKRLASTGTLDVVATAVPGIKDILVLGKVKQIETQIGAGIGGAPDCIIVDAPAAGHAISFLSSAYGLADAASVGPIRSQATDVIALLSDPQRCQVMLVTIPEETPVNEAADTAFHLEDRAGVQLAPIVVNGVWPHLDLPDSPDKAGLAELGLSEGEAAALWRSAEFRRHRQKLQDTQMTRLAEMLPLVQLRLPYVFKTELGLPEVELLATALGIEMTGHRP
jgi:anion-transporting  ArsA/GET3 family ATPase